MGQPLLRLVTVPSDIKPNRKRALIYFKDNKKKLLRTTYAAEEKATMEIPQSLNPASISQASNANDQTSFKI